MEYMWNLREEVYTRLVFYLIFLMGMETNYFAIELEWEKKWMWHQICGSRRRISQYNFGMNISSFSASKCSFLFMFFVVWALWRKHFNEGKEIKERFQSQLFPPQTFQSPVSFSVLRDPLECHLLFSSCKSFSLSPPFPRGSPFFWAGLSSLCEPSLLLLILLQLPHWGWHLSSALSGRSEDWDWGNWYKFFWVNNLFLDDPLISQDKVSLIRVKFVAKPKFERVWV